MEYTKIKDLLSFVIFGENSWRSKIEYGNKEQFKISLDLHGLTREHASTMVNNTIAIIRCQYTLELIHGYNRGTVLKQLIYNDLAKTNKHISSVKAIPHNPGMSILNITY